MKFLDGPGSCDHEPEFKGQRKLVNTNEKNQGRFSSVIVSVYNQRYKLEKCGNLITNSISFYINLYVFILILII